MNPRSFKSEINKTLKLSENHSRSRDLIWNRPMNLIMPWVVQPSLLSLGFTMKWIASLALPYQSCLAIKFCPDKTIKHLARIIAQEVN